MMFAYVGKEKRGNRSHGLLRRALCVEERTRRGSGNVYGLIQYGTSTITHLFHEFLEQGFVVNSYGIRA
jgi:hypothetical protein